MKRAAVLVLALCVLPVLAEDKKDSKDSDKEPAKATAFQKLSYDKALEKAKADKKLVMIDFYADWCGPCKQLDAKTFSEEKVQKFLKTNTIAIKVNVDDNAKLSGKYKITAIPCLVFLDGEGKEVGRLLGFREAEKFLDEAGKIVK
jgi:thiol:disulfide interchange protein